MGSRPSKLSQTQTTMVAEMLRRTSKAPIELVPIKTQGDASPPSRKSSQGAKGAFTRDIESKLLAGEIDVAVHSMKDLPNEMPEGLAIGATPRRADPRDGLLTRNGETFIGLRRGARVGTGSLRRKAQLLKLRGDLDVAALSGNVDTRIRKLASEFDAVVLAMAGLERMGEAGRVSQVFSVDEVVPAVCQGILAVQIRRDDSRMASIVAAIDDPSTRLESECERAFSKRMGSDCYVPIGGSARLSGSQISMVGVIASEDGKEFVRSSMSGQRKSAAEIGERVADGLLSSGGAEILERIAQ